MREGIDGKTDLEALEEVSPKTIALKNCSREYRQSRLRGNDGERIVLSARKPSLPRLKFLEGKD